MLTIRYLLSAENRRRDAEPADTVYDNVYIERLNEDGVMEKARVDKVCLIVHLVRTLMALQEFLDLTDKQNRDFRYVL